MKLSFATKNSGDQNWMALEAISNPYPTYEENQADPERKTLKES